MKKRLIALILIVVVTGMVIFALNEEHVKENPPSPPVKQLPISNHQPTQSRPASNRPATVQTAAVAPKALGRGGKGPTPVEVFIPKDESERSLQQLVGALHIMGRPGSGLESIKRHLHDQHLKPVVRRDSNPYTGNLDIVRTENRLPGTRYFHAQVFSDGKANEVIQHISFEYRPGENSFQRAIEAVRAGLKLRQQPTHQKEDFVSWNMDNGRVIWIKKLNSDDLKNDPFNAYTLNDVGTIRVAIELEIHGDNYHHHK